jgi:hypothetical protein
VNGVLKGAIIEEFSDSCIKCDTLYLSLGNFIAYPRMNMNRTLLSSLFTSLCLMFVEYQSFANKESK